VTLKLVALRAPAAAQSTTDRLPVAGVSRR
jgi:hypothetical protein